MTVGPLARSRREGHEAGLSRRGAHSSCEGRFRQFVRKIFPAGARRDGRRGGALPHFPAGALSRLGLSLSAHRRSAAAVQASSPGWMNMLRRDYSCEPARVTAAAAASPPHSQPVLAPVALAGGLFNQALSSIL